MSNELRSPINGSEKAGNSEELRANLTLIDWDRKTILQKYSVDKVDSDGDLIVVVESRQVTLSPEEFDYWISEEMKSATLAKIVEDYSKEEEEEV